MERLPLEASPSEAMLAIWDALRALGRTLGEPVPGDNDTVQIEREEYLALKRIEDSARFATSYAREMSRHPVGMVESFTRQLENLDKIRRSL